MSELDFGFITSDSHIGTPPHIADELPPEHRARVTHFEERADGVYLVRPIANPFADSAKMGDGGVSLMSEEDQKKMAGGDEVTLALARGVKVDPEDDETIAGYIT